MKAWRYGNDVNTDQLFPGKYTYTISKAEEILPHLLEDLDPGFAAEVKRGDVLVAGRNFGCGSSREQPAVGLKAAGIAFILAESYSRIFFRAAVNQGLVLVECPEAVRAFQEGDEVAFDAAKGTLAVGKQTFQVAPLPDLLLTIRDAGGLLPAVRGRLAARDRATESGRRGGTT